MRPPTQPTVTLGAYYDAVYFLYSFTGMNHQKQFEFIQKVMPTVTNYPYCLAKVP